MALKTKTGIGILLCVYFFSHSFAQWIFGFSTPVYAADETHEQIIAVFVDKDVYDKHTDDINRYAQQYLQSHSPATKALLMPIDKDHFQAQDIRKMLENLYQEGIKEKRSSLIGTILIGDIPLPVINENTYIYPSIYPYTDLEKPTYTYDDASTYFIPQEKGDHKADIRQSVINFEQRDDEYTKFFGKLRTYDKDPTGYASTKIRYDDFIGLKKYFSDQFLSGYINNFLFHEDITYHRFTNLILDYFKDGSNTNAVSLISDYTKNTPMSSDDDYSQLGDVGDAYKSAISSWKSNLNQMATNASSDLNQIGNDSDKIPTLMIGQALSSLIRPYTDLFAPEFLNTISNNISAGGRRTDADVDSHIKKTVLKDNLSSPVLLDANTVMEKALYTKLQTDTYALHIPIPLLYEEYDCTPLPPWPFKRIKGRFENFYFGKSAFDITSTQDISIYPGTRKNIGNRQKLTAYDYTTQGGQDDISLDYTTRSVGASYGIASRQVESSRGYDTLLVPSDEQFYDARKCSKSESIDDFVGKYRGGISPLNVDGNTLQLKQNNPKMAWNPRFDTTIGGPVYDIAGSKMTLTKMNDELFFLDEMNNSMLHRTQQFRIAPRLVCGKLVPPGEVDENRYNGYPHMDGKDAEYFSTYNAGANVTLTANNTNTSAHACGKNYVYKTIDTLESHTSPTPDQISAMTPLTPDRPIDSARFVGFKGIGGDAVKFDYPNIYNVSVYKKSAGMLTIMTPTEIADSIKEYLKQKVVAINTQLSTENTKASSYYSSNGKAYDNLSSIDQLATPKGRTYAMLPDTFFIDALGNDTIDAVANILYWQNLGRSTKPASPDLMTDLKNNQGFLDINKKIGYVVANYLTKVDTPSAAIVPGYEPKGYELAYINSDGNDLLTNTTAPAIIDEITQKKLSATNAISSSDAVNAGLEMVDTEQKEECGIEKNGTVPLLKWPKALACRMKSLKKLALSDVIKINFKNAQGPVLSLDQFKDTATTRGDSVQNFSNQRGAILGTNKTNNGLSQDAQELVRQLDSTIEMKLNKSVVSMDDKADLALTMSSNSDIGNITVRITGTGDNCPIVAGKNVCKSEYAFAANLFSSPRTVPVTLAGTNVGSSVLNVKVCQSARCTEQQLIIPITAGAMTNISIVTPTDKVLYGSQVPIALTATDTYGNPIEQTTTTYRLSSSLGSIIANGNNATGIDLQEFSKNQEYYLDLSNVAPGTKDVQINLDPLNADPSSVAPRATKTLSLTSGKITVKYNAQTASTIDATLPEDVSSYFKSQNGVAQLQESALPRMTITLTATDGKPLDSIAVVKSTQGLLIPGTSQSTTYTLSGKEITAKEFKQQDSFVIKGGVATIILYPSFHAGNDTLTIEVPGTPIQSIPVTIKPASAYRVSLQTPETVYPGETVSGMALVYDRWDNPVNSATTIAVQSLGDLQVNGVASGTVTTDQYGAATLMLSSGKLGGAQYVYGKLVGVTDAQQLPDAKSITVLAPQRKPANLNAMYLLLGGNDRGNRWNYFSQQGNQAEDVLTSSDKTLAVTTLLTHPDHILSSFVRLNSNAQIYDATEIPLVIKGNDLAYDFAEKGYISLGASNSFSLIQGSGTQKLNDQSLIYTPEQLDSVITSNEVKNNTIMINGDPVRSLDPASPHIAQIVSTSNYDNNRDQIRDVVFQGNRIGTLRLHAHVEERNMHLKDSLGVQQTWLGGSTNSPMGWMVYDKNSAPLSAQSSRAGGPEASRDTDTNTSRRNTFQAATAFSEGDSVGLASQHGASPFLISLGDPLISRQTNNPTVTGTNYDAGQGKTVFTETEKSISKTVPFDLDKDGQKDLLIIYTDGSIRILKNEGGKDPYKNLGMLMVIADGIKNVYVGDTDGNGYQDIMVQTTDDTLRVYKNDKGTMDVDGRQVCLSIPGGDENVKNAHEIFVKDMDKDGNLDIVTNDTLGNITVFYGGSSSAGDNYISKNATNCDDGRQTRVDGHKKLVKSYGVSLTDGQKVYDNSLLHRKGLVIPKEIDANNDNEEMTLASQPQFQNLLKGSASDFSSLNVSNIVNSGLPEIIQYSASPVSTLPVYEDGLTADTIAYEPIHLLDSTSPATVYKQYSKKTNGVLKNGDQIDVTVTITATQNSLFTYLDEIKGPRQLAQNDDGSIDSWNQGNLPSTATIDRNISNGYAFMLDNLSLQAGQTVTFGYTLTYVAPKLVSISLEDTNADSYTDIKTYSTDSCQKGYRSFISNRGKSFAESFVDLSSKVADLQKQSEDDVKAALSDVQGKIQTASDTKEPDVKNMPGMDQVLETRAKDQSDSLLQDGSLNLNISVNNDKLQQFTDKAQKAVDKALKGLCQGFKLGQGGATSGPPVPFNMAFLSPGTYNIFGCKLMNDKGLPAFFYPGTIYAGPYTIPFPYGEKGAGDGFYRAQGGVYPSMIRIYVSPTLTMGVGVAICFGSYSVGANMPSPFRHIAGNCIVLAKTFSQKKNTNTTNDNAQLTVPAWQYDLAQGGTCNRPSNDPAKPSSPFTLGTTSNKTTSNNVGGSVTSSTPPAGGYAGGLIYFDQEPKAVSVSAPAAGSETLKGGKALKLQIQGGNVRGLVKCIINKWLDNQIRYIINNLTNLSVNLYLPDLSTLFQGFDNLSLDKLGNLYNEVQRQTSPSPSARQNVVKSLFTKEGMRQNSNAVSNPFDALSSLFENVPLINVNTRNINIQIPFISQEDLVKYKAYLTDRLKRNESILKEWTMVAQDLAGKCDSYKSPSDKSACKQKVDAYVSVGVKSAQVIKALKGNINTLEEYRKFPLELNKWLSISQRYLTEVSDTVATFTAGITHRLQVNARRFEQYVDAIILVISAIKTWQVLIDFSVNRKTKCGKCRVDNYDFYSCTLSLLCINLPVLPIPNFRIPNIDIDLSHVNLGLDILLPKFNFVPKNIPLPKLPDLPAPPSINLNVDLNVVIPQIPVLPSPPKLPELPSFIPNIELNLPTLPPAPRIPKIAPQITATLKVAEFIAKIFCIVKGGIGLVSEKGVKTRIEQMTQRTWAVEPFDSISITKVQPPQKGFDIHIDTYINLQINFNGVYDLLNTFAQQINKSTNEVFSNLVSENIASFSQQAGKVGDAAQNTVDQGNVNGVNIQGLVWPHRRDLQYDNTEAGRIDLHKQIYSLQQADTSAARLAKLHSIVAFMDTPADTTINTDGINELRDQASAIVYQKKAEISDIQNKIANDYDSFVHSLQTTLVSDDTQSATLGAALFKGNKSVVDTVKSEPHPTQSYLELNKTIMDGFAKSLHDHSASDLNMSLLTYNETKNYVNETRAAVDEGLNALAMSDTNNQPATTKPLLAATTAGSSTAMSAMSSDAGNMQSDVSQYIKGIFVKDANNDMVNVDNREDIIDTLQTNQVREDLNNDNEDDIVLRDQQQVWIKYAHPEKQPASTAFTRLYRTPTFASPRDVENAVSRGGRISVAGSTFKIRDIYTAPHGFAVEGQSYDTIALSWDNDYQDGYIIQLTDQAFTRHDHLSDSTNTKYALLLPNDMNTGGLFLYNELLGGQKRVSDLISNGSIVQISYYDTGDESLGLTLRDLPRARHYVAVAKLSRKTLNQSALLLEKASPRSQQEVGGTQLAADTASPSPEVTLVRTENGVIEGQGFSLTPIIGNAYSLIIKWSDDAGVKDNSVTFGNGNSQVTAGDKTTINTLVRKNDNEVLTIGAHDQLGNAATYTINLHRKKATIDITDIAHPTDASSVIDTSISQGLDKGNVSFERQRDGIRSVMQGKNTTSGLLSLFPLGFNQQALSGGVFVKNNSLGLYNQDGKRIATINKDNGQLSLDAAYKDSIDVQVVFTSNTPTIVLKEKATGKALFSIVLKGKTALNTTVSDTAKRQQKKLNDGYGQTFTNGTCVADLQNHCQIYISTQGAIRLPDEYKNDFIGKYSYDNNTNAIVIELFDREGKSVATTSFISQPLP